nr:MAG TPA: hypothetical protein [Caudoviricetes sp.]
MINVDKEKLGRFTSGITPGITLVSHRYHPLVSHWYHKYVTIYYTLS